MCMQEPNLKPRPNNKFVFITYFYCNYLYTRYEYNMQHLLLLLLLIIFIKYIYEHTVNKRICAFSFSSPSGTFDLIGKLMFHCSTYYKFYSKRKAEWRTFWPRNFGATLLIQLPYARRLSVSFQKLPRFVGFVSAHCPVFRTPNFWILHGYEGKNYPNITSLYRSTRTRSNYRHLDASRIKIYTLFQMSVE